MHPLISPFYLDLLFSKSSTFFSACFYFKRIELISSCSHVERFYQRFNWAKQTNNGVPLTLCLCFNRIFGHEGSDADNIIYVNWLNMVRAGLLGLEFFTPENNKWRQVRKTLSTLTAIIINQPLGNKIHLPSTLVN